jgi:hypothetical protein
MSDKNKPNSTGIYAATVGSGITATGAYSIADFQGAAALNFSIESMVAFGQNFWPQEYALNQIEVGLSLGGVFWNTANIVATLLGVSAAAGSVLAAGSATATIWNITTAMTSIPVKEYLISTTRSSDSKVFQIKAFSGRLATDMSLGLSKDTWIQTDMGIALYADGSGNMLRFIEES